MAKVVHITSPQHFTQVLQSSRIVVTDFWADWCAPCKAIAPIFEGLAEQLTRPNIITFTKVDTEAQANKDIAQTYNITALPTFMIFKNGRETKTIRGANAKELDAAIKQLAQEAANAGDMNAGEGSSGSGWTPLPAPRNYADITDAVDVLGLDFSNLDAGAKDQRSIFSTSKPASLDTKGKSAEGAAKDWIESDLDGQLMLLIPFQSTVKLHSLHITSIPASSDDDEEPPMRPKQLKLFTNEVTVLNFDEADTAAAVQTIELKPSDWDEKTSTARVELRFVKFQNISSLVLYVAAGDGDGDKTRIDRIRLFGETGEKKNPGKLEKIGDDDH